jgi:hypothetical protein
MQEEFKRLKKKGFSNAKFDAHIVNPNITTLFTKDQLEELKSIWYSNAPKEKEVKPSSALFTLDIKEEEVELVIDELVEEELFAMNKDQLDEYSINTYGIDLF